MRTRKGAWRAVWDKVWTQVGHKISSYLSTAEWWKASGACKAMSLVQRDHIVIQPRSTRALCWLVRHWSRARVLDLRLDHLPVLCSEGRSNLILWKHLELASWEARDVVDWAASLTCVRALHISLGTLYNISPLTQLPLRHLHLEICKCVPLGGVDLLGSMHLLETLVIHCTSEGDSFEGHPDEGNIFPSLDLRGCNKLYAVAFKMSIPMQVQVPESCATLFESGCRLLDTVSPALKICTSCKCILNSNSRLSEMLGHRFAALTSLQINGNFDPGYRYDDDYDDDSDEDDDGMYEPLSIVLGDDVRHLRFLDIRSSRRRRGVCLKIAAPLQLVSLQVLAEGPLRVDICDVGIGALAAALQVVHLQGSNMPERSARLKLLLKKVGEMGKAYVTYTSIPQDASLTSHGVCWMAGVRQKRRQAIRDYFDTCRCGACWGCLKRSGVLDRLLQH